MTRYARVPAQPSRACKPWTSQPHIIVPIAVPAVPIKVYQAKMSLRMLEGVSWASVDSSMARKGPISLPLDGISDLFHPRCTSRSQRLRTEQRPIYPPWTNNAKDTRGNQDPIIATESEDYATCTHQRSAQHQYPSSAQPIRKQGQAETNHYIAQQSQCHEQTNSRLGNAQAGKIEDENQGGGAISKEADETLEAKQFGIASRAHDGVDTQLGGRFGEEGCWFRGGRGHLVHDLVLRGAQQWSDDGRLLRNGGRCLGGLDAAEGFFGLFTA